MDIFRNPHEVDSKLLKFGVSKQELISIALQAVSARNSVTPLHPVTAPGTYSYMEGVAALRQVFLRKDGWKKDRPNGLEAITNSTQNLTIVFQNVDRACGREEPQPISGKGEGARKFVQNPTLYLFEYMEHEDREASNQSVWFFCVSANGDEVRAELSLPSSIEDKSFGAFEERIFIISDDDWFPEDDDSTYDEDEFDIQVTRK